MQKPTFHIFSDPGEFCLGSQMRHYKPSLSAECSSFVWNSVTFKELNIQTKDLQNHDPSPTFFISSVIMIHSCAQGILSIVQTPGKAHIYLIFPAWIGMGHRENYIFVNKLI